MDSQVTNYENAWDLIKLSFPILDGNYNINEKYENTYEEFYIAANIIKTTELTSTIQDIVLSKVEETLRNTVAPQFWSYFTCYDNVKGFKQFFNAIRYLYDSYLILYRIFERLESLKKINNCEENNYGRDVKAAFQIIVKSTLYSKRESTYEKVVTDFYEQALQEAIEENEHNSGKVCLICVQEGYCNCSNLFIETNGKLAEMGLLESLSDQLLSNLIYNCIQNHIIKSCKDKFDVSFTDYLENWLDRVVLTWLKKVYYSVENSDELMKKFENKLKLFLYHNYTKCRIDQLFTIIIEYPESLAALKDLRSWLPKTDQKPYLTKTLQKAMETRLLHPGVSTSDILTAYIAAFHSLQILDPSGLLLEVVILPIHQYLRSREDTIRCVVTSLTEDGPNDLAEELVRGEAVCIDNSMDDGNDDWENWMPDPVDMQPPTEQPLSKRSSDILSMLINVYGSKDLFVNEYRTLLADRLLSQYTCDTEKEIRYLELLKLRFGDSQLHYCEVMLKDIVDSKRICQNIKQDPNYVENVPMSAMIVSGQFWPSFKEEKLELHDKLLQQIERYTKGFELLKGSRTLYWKYHLGVVDLEIELADRTLNLSVSPVHATIMMHFQDRNKWPLDELSKVMQIPPTILRKKMWFWQSNSILIESEPEVFELREHNNLDDNVQEDVIIEEYESESAMASAQDQREEELQTFWSYIVGMLMNLDSLSLERIHQMLKMFAFQGSSIEYNTHELKAFLDKKVRDHQLIHSNGLYKLPK